jgi:hypothetical protein
MPDWSQEVLTRVQVGQWGVTGGCWRLAAVAKPVLSNVQSVASCSDLLWISAAGRRARLIPLATGRPHVPDPLSPPPLTPSLSPLQQALPDVPAIDQLTVNEYKPGVGIAPHVDAHSSFTGEGGGLQQQQHMHRGRCSFWICVYDARLPAWSGSYAH